jgi:hypothetical protein
MNQFAAMITDAELGVRTSLRLYSPKLWSTNVIAWLRQRVALECRAEVFLVGLFHLIVVFSLNEEEKQAFVDAGIEFKRTTKVPGGETITFEIGEHDPRWNKIEALLRSLGDHRFRDDSMTVATLEEYVTKFVLPGAEKMAEVRGKWEPGREATSKCCQLARVGKTLEALSVLDMAIGQAVTERRGMWVTFLCDQGRAFAHHLGDHGREIGYAEQSLPFATEYRFAAYNLAQLLLKHGHGGRAMHHATEAYRLSMTHETESDHDLRAAILRQWPDISKPAKLT